MKTPLFTYGNLEIKVYIDFIDNTTNTFGEKPTWVTVVGTMDGENKKMMVDGLCTSFRFSEHSEFVDFLSKLTAKLE